MALSAAVVATAQRTVAVEDGVNHNNGVAVAATTPPRRRDLAMLTTSTRLKLQDILRRLASGTSVSLEERVYLQKFADCDRTVASWLRQARRQQLAGHHRSGMDGFLNSWIWELQNLIRSIGRIAMISAIGSEVRIPG